MEFQSYYYPDVCRMMMKEDDRERERGGGGCIHPQNLFHSPTLQFVKIERVGQTMGSMSTLSLSYHEGFIIGFQYFLNNDRKFRKQLKNNCNTLHGRVLIGDKDDRGGGWNDQES
jgi:hypothetical protein